MLTTTLRSKSRRLHAGLSLVESLVAILVLALGIAGLAWTQARLLVEGRSANARSTAILHISDLSNRMMFNQATAASGGYSLAWGEVPPARNCSTTCSGGELAQSDLAAWRAALSQALPTGNASVFRSAGDPRQIGIAISWAMQDSKAADTDAAKYQAPFSVTVASYGVDCPAGQHCHVVYVQP